MITANLVLLDGKYYAEYENQDGSVHVCVEVDGEDFNTFAEVEMKENKLVTKDRDFDDWRCTYETWFDDVDYLRTEYAKTLLAYYAAVLLAAVVSTENK